MDERRVFSLARIPFLQDVGLDFSPYESLTRWRRFDADEVLVDFGDETRDVYFIASGEARILIRTVSGKELILDEMRAGDFFGELAAIDGIKRSANVTALTRGEVCILSPKTFLDMTLRAPALTQRLLCHLTGRVRELNTRLVEHSILDVRHRLYGELLRLSVPRTNHPSERVITPPPYHHVMAARIGCRREQITRELAVLDTDGLIDRTKGALVLLRPDLLEARIQNAMQNDE